MHHYNTSGMNIACDTEITGLIAIAPTQHFDLKIIHDQELLLKSPWQFL